MATEGKHSPFSIKTMVLSGGGFLVAWGATKLLDTYFDTTLLADAKVWLLLDTPMPNWSVLTLLLLTLTTMLLATYYFRVAHTVHDELTEIKNPPDQQLTASQHKVIMRVAHLSEKGAMLDTKTIALRQNLEPLEVEVCVEQLIAKDYLQWIPTNTPCENPWVTLALKGKEYVLRVRSDVRPLLG
jgi:hypothetical protein